MADTTIRVMHMGCGDMELLAADLHLKTFAPAGRDFYEFICSVCDKLVQKSADDHVVALLRSGLVPETKIFLPIEALDPMRNLTDPLTRDDLLDFHISIHSTAFLPYELERQ